MVWQYAFTPLSTVLVVTAGAVVVVAAYVVYQQRAYKPVPGGYVAVGLSLAAAATLLAGAAQLASGDVEKALLWRKASAVVAATVPFLFFLFALRYTNTGDRLVRWIATLAAVVPIVVVGLIVTNGTYHTLVYTGTAVDASGVHTAVDLEYGPVGYGYVAYGALLAVVSVGLFGRRALQVRGIYRKQAMLLAAAALLPVGVGVIEYGTGGTAAPFNATFIVLGLTAIAIPWGVARHGLFRLAPIASEAAVEQMDDAVIVIDIRGLVVNVNPQAEPFLTVAPGNAVGRSVGSALRPFAVPPAPESGSDSDVEVVTDPETERCYRRIGTPLTDPDGALMGQLIVLQDITERVRREERLSQQNEQLEQFASVVSHDLRNPLNVISGRVQLAHETGGDEHFEAIERAADRMDGLIDELLQLARQGQAVSEPERVILRNVAEDAWLLVEAPAASLEVAGEVAIEADRDRLQQALENLFRNAIEHAGEDVSVFVEPLAGDGAGFAVEDDGPGIPPDEQDQVFEYGRTTDENGTGFGLAIVEEIIDAHGWSIRATDGKRSGTGDADTGGYGGARFEITGVSTGGRSSSDGGDEGTEVGDGAVEEIEPTGGDENRGSAIENELGEVESGFNFE